MVFIAILFLFPALITLVNSFKTDAEIVLNPVSWPQSFSLRNYYAAWQEMNFPLVLFNTFITFEHLGIIMSAPWQPISWSGPRHESVGWYS